MKKRLSRFFFLAVLFCLNTACDGLDDLNNTVVEGHVIDATTNQPIPFARVEVMGMYTKVSYPAFNSYIIGGEADANGKFSLSFDTEKDNNYAITGRMPDKYYTVEDIFPQKSGVYKNLKLMMQPYAYVNVNIINDPPLDVAEFRWQQYHRLMQDQFSTFMDVNWLLQIDANKPVEINYWMGVNGSPLILHSKTVTVAAFDTLEMEVRY